MPTNPDPHKTPLNFDSECAVMDTDAHRPELSNFLEVKGRVRGISFERW
jgi:hypothetical protein